MDNFVCNNCNWVYEPKRGDGEGGVPMGTDFKDLPIDYVCPMCGAKKEMFAKEQ
ncbi:MAG: rubredoxin [Bacillota bacterium]|nr:rubredoxin [Bacillota bacterium]